MEEVDNQIILEEADNRFLVAEQYLNTSKNLLDLMIINKNQKVIITKITDEKTIDIDDIFGNLKNSSIFTIIPTIFLFYQGMELIIKGFVLIKQKDVKSSHDIQKLFIEFKKYYLEEKNIITILERYINKLLPFLKKFNEDNNITNSKDFYNALRYPEGNGKNIKSIDYYALKYYKNEEFIPQITEFSNDIKALIEYSNNLFSRIKKSYTVK